MVHNLKGKIVRSRPYSLDASLSIEGSAAEAKATGKALEKVFEDAKALTDKHVGNIENPHNVTKKQVGLGNVDNTADKDKPVSTAQEAAIKAVSDAVARLNAKKAETASLRGVLLAENWSDGEPYVQEIVVDGVLATDEPFVDLDLSDVADALAAIEAYGLVGRYTANADNRITAYCYQDLPQVDIPLKFKVVR